MINSEILNIFVKQGYSLDKIKAMSTLLFYIDNGFIDIQSVSEDELNLLRRLRLIQKDYSTSQINLRIPLYNCDDTETKVTDPTDEWIKSYQDLTLVNGKPFKPGAKSDKKEIKGKLKKFFKAYSEYTLEDVYEAYEYYIRQNKHQPAFIPRANYFIWKEGTGSLAATVIEEVRSMGTEDESTYKTLI